MNVALIRGADLVATPWKNGGGITREVAARADAWRVSIADIDRPGPFSRFDGIDRMLVVLDGAGLMLGAQSVLRAFGIARFPGESQVDARLADGAVRVFNVMTHRGAARARVDLWRAPASRIVDAGTALLHCARGPLDVRVGDTRIALMQNDTLRIDGANRAEIDIQGNTCDAVLVCASLDIEGQP
ncbi:HutD family protein [Caballeronia sp. Lep1P3]|uniref:HutD/Ves family protein n=1 Tax=Caballeronia sp. Lep1P3 TaxID=2878150 RepID=UPI001FD5C1E5|nr:HutD family protein [Caballeronia sp. Lep1P3]